MDIGTLLAPEAVVLDGATSQKQVFERAGALLAAGSAVPADDIAAALAERERQGTTGFGQGAAVPHGRVKGLPRLALAVIRLTQPVDWGAVDGLPVDLVMALGLGEAGADNLKALALVSRTLRDQQLVEKLRGVDDAGAMWALLVGPTRQAA